MDKHKLFVESQSSINLSSSVNESPRTMRSKKAASAKASKAGVMTTSTPIRANLHQPQKQTSVLEDADVRKVARNHKEFANWSVVPASAKDSDSDSDSMNVSIFSSSTQKVPYSYKEDEEILKFIYQGQNIFKVSSILLWKNLEYKKKNPRRTYQSLKNRFLRNIKPKLFSVYRHLIPDDDTVEKILIKFPDLKNQVTKKESLSKVTLPKRITAEKRSSPISDTENDSDVEISEVVENRRLIPAAKTRPGPSNLNFHRRVEISEDSLTIHVNLRYTHPPPRMTRIYERYLNLKLKNKLAPCPACGRGGGPEPLLDSGAESDTVISNSLESRKSESPPKKKLNKRKNRSFQSQKRKKKNVVEESNSGQVSCSPSLLNDVNEVDVLDEYAIQIAEFKKENADAFESPNYGVLVTEADSTPEHTASSKDTNSIYQNTVSEFRKLIDSDEEEVLVRKCLRKNSKSIGFDVKMSNMSAEEIQVDSYFIKSDSPVESETASATPGDGGKSKTLTEKSAGGSLVQNMMNMLGKTDIKNGYNLRKNRSVFFLCKNNFGTFDKSNDEV